MPNLFRIRRNGFERIKVTQYFVVVVVVLYVQCIYGPIWSCVGSFRYGSVVCCTSTDNNKSFLILVMAESFTCLFSWDGGNFSFSISVFNGNNCFSNQIKLNVMACFNVSYYIPAFAFSNQCQFYIRFYYFLKSLIHILFWIFNLCFFYYNSYISS